MNGVVKLATAVAMFGLGIFGILALAPAPEPRPDLSGIEAPALDSGGPVQTITLTNAVPSLTVGTSSGVLTFISSSSGTAINGTTITTIASTGYSINNRIVYDANCVPRRPRPEEVAKDMIASLSEMKAPAPEVLAAR